MPTSQHDTRADRLWVPLLTQYRRQGGAVEIDPDRTAAHLSFIRPWVGQFLLAAGAKGKRYALPHARIMMHQPSAGIGGTASDITIQAEQFAATKKEMARLIAQHTGQPVERIEEDSDRDRWFTAAEAKEYGLVDHVVTALKDTAR